MSYPMVHLKVAYGLLAQYGGVLHASSDGLGERQVHLDAVSGKADAECGF